MKFYDWTLLQNYIRKKYPTAPIAKAKLQDFCKITLAAMLRDGTTVKLDSPDPVERQTGVDICRVYLDQHWDNIQRPYYNLWPVVVPMFLKVKLSVPCNCLRLPFSTFVLRLPKQAAPLVYQDDRKHIRTITAIRGSTMPAEMSPLSIDQLLIEFQTSCPTLSEEEQAGTSVITFPLIADTTIEQMLTQSVGPVTLQLSAAAMVLRLCLGVCLLDNDPSIISPDVLDCDRLKYDETKHQKYIDKAHRRGKVGWDIGKGLEVVPHLRMPHFGWRWTGPGGKIPKLVPIEGSIVHRNKLLEVPTGFAGGPDV